MKPTRISALVILLVVMVAILSSCGSKLEGTYVATADPDSKLIFEGDKLILETKYGRNSYEYEVKNNKVLTKSGIYPIDDNGCISAVGNLYCK